MKTNSHSHQRGIVLITAILIVVIIASVAATLGLAQQVWLRQTENFMDRAQADSLRYSAINWVAILLTRDAKDNKVDHLDELWAKQLPPLPTEGGMIAVAIRDAQSLFNLNNLIRNNAPSPADISMFQRLLTAQGLDPALVYTLLDWIDQDSQASQGGAEDVDYLAGSPPYRAANQLLTSIDELRLIRGFTPQVVEKIRPLVTVLPKSTTINVNTAIEPVLLAMFPSPPAGLDGFLKNRETQPIKAQGDFMKQLPAGSTAPQVAYGINTEYFLVTIGVRIGRLDRRSEVLVERPISGQPAHALWFRTNPVQIQTKTDENT
jgi:general secretion pathway protein K